MDNHAQDGETGSLRGVVAWLEAEVRSPLPERKSLHTVAVRHPQQGHRIGDLARQLYLKFVVRRRFDFAYFDR